MSHVLKGHRCHIRNVTLEANRHVASIYINIILNIVIMLLLMQHVPNQKQATYCPFIFSSSCYYLKYARTPSNFKEKYSSKSAYLWLAAVNATAFYIEYNLSYSGSSDSKAW